VDRVTGGGPDRFTRGVWYRAVAAIAATLALLSGSLDAGAGRAAEPGRAAGPASAVRPDPDANANALEVAFAEGYASALLREILGIQDFTIGLEDGSLDVALKQEPEQPVDRILRNLLGVRGVEQVRIRIGDRLLAESPVPGSRASETASAEDDGDGDGDGDGRQTEGPTHADAPARNGYEIFPAQELFATLIADPRWPRFSVSHQWYLGDDELDRVGATSFGETFALVRSPKADWGEWEIAFQAGVFSVFDLEADSFDLVNSDFLVGLSASHHLGDLTTMIRIYHQSSHLGDEFLLRNRVDRVNLSFEVLDLLISYEPWSWLRLYGGGGVIVHREPDLDRGITQIGLELTSPTAFASGYLRPLAAIDLQHREESDWKTDLSLRSGVQIEHPRLGSRRLQILGEFYSGRSPNGQFFDRSIETLGLGIHLGF
jgi:hypothetical protein